MNFIGKYVARNELLKKILSSSDLLKEVAGRYVLGKDLEDISVAVKDWNGQGFGVILYPIEAGAPEYLDSLKFLSEKEIKGSISLRTPLKNMDSVVEEAIKRRVRLELDMRNPETIDQTLQQYSEIKRKHADSVICLQANLYRTAADIEELSSVSPIVRLVKGAFDGENAYQTKEEIDLNFILLAKKLMDKGIKTYLATHDDKIIKEFIKYAKDMEIQKEHFGFQMLHGVRADLQEGLQKEGHELWKYLAYGEDWVPYCINRILERKENIRFALETILRK